MQLNPNSAPLPPTVTVAEVDSTGRAPFQTIIVREAARAGIWAWLGWLLFGLSLVGAYSMSQQYKSYFNEDENVREKYFSGSKTATDKIAILSVEGVIMEGDGFVKHQIDRIAKDENVKVVVLRVDSPGGTVTGSDYILHHLKELKKKRDIKIVVSMGAIAASGGYYVSMAVQDDPDTIFAEPTTITGSIGVIIPHYDLSGLLAKLDVKNDAVASHPRKQMLSMTLPMTEEHRELIQAQVTEMFTRFKGIIKEGRPLFRKDVSALDQLATGEVFSAEQAVKHGLVDKIGFIEAAIERAAALATLDVDKCRVVRYERTGSVLNFIGSAEAQAFDAKSVLQLSAPRGYYLSDPLPSMLVGKKAD